MSVSDHKEPSSYSNVDPFQT